MKLTILLFIAAIAPLLSFAQGGGLITGSTSGCVGSTWALADTIPGGVWYSADTAIATIDSMTGVVTGRAPGTVTIVYYLSSSSYRTTYITVDSTVADSVYIVTSPPLPVPPGTPVTCWAVPLNGGSSPSYEWWVDGNLDVVFSDTLAIPVTNGDSIRVCMTSSLLCATPAPVCTGEMITATATIVISPQNAWGDVQVFPNPAYDAITVQYDFAGGGIMEVTDVMGRVIITASLEAGKQEKDIDVSTLPQGVYVYRIRQHDVFVWTGKFIKE